jgi:hypothetical protein
MNLIGSTSSVRSSGDDKIGLRRSCMAGGDLITHSPADEKRT